MTYPKNYRPGSMSFAEGFLGPKGNVGYFMEFSIEKAKKIAEREGLQNIDKIEAGLDGDWGENSCTIYDSDGWHDYTAWHGSLWAIPIIQIEFKDKPMATFPSWTRVELRRASE